jgi:quinol monooxygenase YgiN
MLATLGVSGSAYAAGAGVDEPESVWVLTFVEVKNDAVGRCKSLLSQYVTALRQHSSLAEVTVVQEIDRPQRFVVLETGGRPNELAAAEVWGQQVLTGLSPLLIAPMDRRSHRNFPDAPAPPVAPVAGKSVSANIYVIAHLDPGPPDQARGQAALVKKIAAARNSPGNLRFDA